MRDGGCGNQRGRVFHNKVERGMVAWTHPFHVPPMTTYLEFNEQPYTLPTAMALPVQGQWFLLRPHGGCTDNVLQNLFEKREGKEVGPGRMWILPLIVYTGKKPQRQAERETETGEFHQSHGRAWANEGPPGTNWWELPHTHVSSPSVFLVTGGTRWRVQMLQATHPTTGQTA